MTRRLSAVLVAAGVFAGCGHTMTTEIGVMSLGELEGRTLPAEPAGEMLEGQDCSGPGGTPYFLSEAVRDAVKDTEYDTLVDVEVTNTTGVLVFSNCIRVRGRGVNSKKLEGAQP